MQALAAAGMGVADIGKKVQLNASATVAKYLDPGRHSPGLERLEQQRFLYSI